MARARPCATPLSRHPALARCPLSRAARAAPLSRRLRSPNPSSFSSPGVGDGEREKAAIAAHPLYERLLEAHVTCLRVAAPVDQLPRIDAQIAARPPPLAAAAGAATAGGPSGGEELDLFMVCLTPTHLAIVMEYAAGGELFEKIITAGRFSEDESRYFFQQLISGVSYYHSMEICHRDLKLENSLLDGSPTPRVKAKRKGEK